MERRGGCTGQNVPDWDVGKAIGWEPEVSKGPHGPRDMVLIFSVQTGQFYRLRSQERGLCSLAVGPLSNGLQTVVNLVTKNTFPSGPSTDF